MTLISKEVFGNPTIITLSILVERIIPFSIAINTSNGFPFVGPFLYLKGNVIPILVSKMYGTNIEC